MIKTIARCALGAKQVLHQVSMEAVIAAASAICAHRSICTAMPPGAALQRKLDLVTHLATTASDQFALQTVGGIVGGGLGEATGRAASAPQSIIRCQTGRCGGIRSRQAFACQGGSTCQAVSVPGY